MLDFVSMAMELIPAFTLEDAAGIGRGLLLTVALSWGGSYAGSRFGGPLLLKEDTLLVSITELASKRRLPDSVAGS